MNADSPDAATPTDALRSELSRPRLQVPLWLALILAATGIICSTWSWATEDTTIGLVGTALLALFIPAVLFLENAVWRSHRENLQSNGPHD